MQCYLLIMWFDGGMSLVVPIAWFVEHRLDDAERANMIGNVCIGIVVVIVCMILCLDG